MPCLEKLEFLFNSFRFFCQDFLIIFPLTVLIRPATSPQLTSPETVLMLTTTLQSMLPEIATVLPTQLAVILPFVSFKKSTPPSIIT